MQFIHSCTEIAKVLKLLKKIKLIGKDYDLRGGGGVVFK